MIDHNSSENTVNVPKLYLGKFMDASSTDHSVITRHDWYMQVLWCSNTFVLLEYIYIYIRILTFCFRDQDVPPEGKRGKGRGQRASPSPFGKLIRK